jgi:hypothetical protein
MVMMMEKNSDCGWGCLWAGVEFAVVMVGDREVVRVIMVTAFSVRT